MHEHLSKSYDEFQKIHLDSLHNALAERVEENPSGNSLFVILLATLCAHMEPRDILVRVRDIEYSRWYGQQARNNKFQAFMCIWAIETLMLESLAQALPVSLAKFTEIVDDKKGAAIITKMRSGDFAIFPDDKKLFKAVEKFIKETLEEDRPLVLAPIDRKGKGKGKGKEQEDRSPRNPGTPRPPRGECINHSKGAPCARLPCPYGPAGHKSHWQRGGGGFFRISLRLLHSV